MRFPKLSLLLVVSTLAAGAISHGQAPANDAFANFQTISGALPRTIPGTTVSATAEFEEPAHASASGGNVASNSVWYRWTSTVDGFVSLEVAGGDFDSTLAVYTGTILDSLVEVASADLFFVGNEEVIFEVQSGTTYVVAVDGFSGSGAVEASGAFDLILSDLPVPANDNFADAELLDPVLDGILVEAYTVAATAEASEPDHANFFGNNIASNSVWYRWTAPETTVAAANVVGLFDSAVAVYTGTSLSNLTEVGSSDLYVNQAPERAVFDAVQGTEYFIAVDGFSTTGSNGEFGQFFLEVYEVPSNDNFFARDVLGSTLPQSITGSTINASAEFVFGEPEHANAIGNNLASNSVWYSWTAAADESVMIDVVDANFDVVLAVYTGTALTNLVEVAAADDGVGEGGESVTISAVAGTTYVIAVDKWTNTGSVVGGGTFTLNLTGENGGGGDGPYDLWIANFPSLTGEDAEPAANPSGDGVSNALKLVLGLDPTRRLAEDPNRGNFPRLTTFNDNPALQYVVEPGNLGGGADAIQHGGQTSVDLQNWSDIGSLNIGGNTWVIEIAPGGEVERFGRLRVTIP